MKNRVLDYFHVQEPGSQEGMVKIIIADKNLLATFTPRGTTLKTGITEPEGHFFTWLDADGLVLDVPFGP
jgi:hypothetical protein